jgi:hypothetical protein
MSDPDNLSYDPRTWLEPSSDERPSTPVTKAPPASPQPRSSALIAGAATAAILLAGAATAYATRQAPPPIVTASAEPSP